MIKELLTRKTLTYPFVLELPYIRGDYTEYGGILIKSRETLQTLSDEFDNYEDDFETFFRETQPLDWRVELHEHGNGYEIPDLKDLEVYELDTKKKTIKECSNVYFSFYREFEGCTKE